MPLKHFGARHFGARHFTTWFAAGWNQFTTALAAFVPWLRRRRRR